VDKSGNVGIGTTIPAHKLDVDGAHIVARFQGTPNTYGDTAVTIVNKNSNAPIWALSAKSNGSFAIHQCGQADRITLLNGGNVGIGTTIPAYKLDVAGEIHATGEITAPIFNGVASGITDGAVTSAKIAADAVTSSKIQQPIELSGTISYATYALDAGTATFASTATYALKGSHYIGEVYGGGIVFWVDSSGEHGLIATTTDQSTDIQWYNGAYGTTNAVRNGLYAGRYNTERIIATQSTGSYAAQICANCQEGDYGDWYLPSKYELNLLYLQKDAVGGFSNNNYWSSTEENSDNAWRQDFSDGSQSSADKNTSCYVRAIRAF
jgi:hypothetical protein